MRKLIWIGLASFLFVTGCTTTKTPTATTLPSGEQISTSTQQTWAERESNLRKIHSWYLSGKIAVQAQKNSGSASVNWSQGASGQYNVSLFGPLGSGGLKLSGRKGVVTMETSDGKRAQAPSAEQLLREQWGWNLPVSNLNYWVRGIPVPGVSYQGQFDSANRLSSMDQQGWHIEYLNYTNKGGVDLPQKMAISSSALRSRIVIYNWNIAAR